MKSAELFSIKRVVGEMVYSCRGKYRWSVKRRRRNPDTLPGPCYRVNPLTGERTLLA